MKNLEWNKKIDELAQQDYTIIDDFLPSHLYKHLKSLFKESLEEDEFRPAGIGAFNTYQIRESIRNDEILWLQRDGCTEELGDFFRFIEEFIPYVNRHLFTGLKDYEFMLAHYPRGGFYKKHLDQFRDRNNRILTMLVYMNDNWEKGDGGELKVYTNSDFSEFKLIEPIANRMVIFRSDTVWHEVLLTHKSRKSLTGWLLKHPQGLGFLG